ncbi:MAG: cupin domain-containing protein [Candidatus Thermoplasmatota archaeon]
MIHAISSREARVVERRIHDKVVRLLTKSREMEAVVIELDPGDSFGEESVHEGEEFKYVLEGQVEFTVVDKRYFLGRGDWLWHRSDLPHSIRNPGPKRCVYVTVVVPPSLV